MLGVDSFYDHEYSDSQLPDDFFTKIYGPVFEHDVVVHQLQERVTFHDVEGRDDDSLIQSSHFGLITGKDFHLEVGPKKHSQPFYIPHEDWTGIDMVFSYSRKISQGASIPFPNIPIAESGIPSNQLQKNHNGYKVEENFAKRGLVLYEPTIGCQLELGNRFPFVREREAGMGMIGAENFTYDTYPKTQKTRFFSSFRDVDKPDVLSMQFNPFHPMSIPLIVEMEWSDDRTVVGIYKYKGNRHKITPFRYSFDDKRYRIYSEQWCTLFQKGERSHFYECYDLVASFPFAELFLDIKGRLIEPFLIEPMTFVGTRYPFPYAPLGPESTLTRFISSAQYCAPYSNTIFYTSNESVRFEEITSETLIVDENVFKYDGVFYPMENYHPKDPDFYLRYIADKTTSRSRIFKRNLEGKFYFFEVPYQCLSFPRNVVGSLVPSFKALTLTEACRYYIYNYAKFHEYLPMWSPYEMQNSSLVVEEDDTITKVLQSHPQNFSQQELGFFEPREIPDNNYNERRQRELIEQMRERESQERKIQELKDNYAERMISHNIEKMKEKKERVQDKDKGLRIREVERKKDLKNYKVEISRKKKVKKKIK